MGLWDDTAPRLGARIRELRVGAGWTQEVLAHEASLHRTYISGLEHGRRNPNMKTLARLAETFGCDFHQLVCLEPQSPGGPT
jgi:transcriptional regulator with XRE-family HTH domain